MLAPGVNLGNASRLALIRNPGRGDTTLSFRLCRPCVALPGLVLTGASASPGLAPWASMWRPFGASNSLRGFKLAPLVPRPLSTYPSKAGPWWPSQHQWPLQGAPACFPRFKEPGPPFPGRRVKPDPQIPPLLAKPRPPARMMPPVSPREFRGRFCPECSRTMRRPPLRGSLPLHGRYRRRRTAVATASAASSIG